MIRRASSTIGLYRGARRPLIWKLEQAVNPWGESAFYWKLVHVVYSARKPGGSES